MKLTKTFDRKGTFNAAHDAEKFLRDRGFSLGSSQADGPQGILFGDYAISKWRNMSSAEIKQLHGVMRGDGREGPLTIYLHDHAPDEAKAAFLQDDDEDGGYCPACNGSGEGAFDGATCSTCRGKGE